MPRHMLKLLALGLVFSVAPAAAGRLPAMKAAHHHDCPHKHAQTSAMAVAVPQQAKGPTTITLPDRVPDGSLLDLGWRRGFFTP